MHTLDLASMLFPTASSQNIGSSPLALSSTAFSSQYQRPPPMTVANASAERTSYFPHSSHTVFPQPRLPPPAPPVRSHSFPPPIYTTSMQQHPQLSPSPQPLQPPSPPTPNSGISNLSINPKPKEPQIRYNENCFNYNLQRHGSIRLDHGSFGRYVDGEHHLSIPPPSKDTAWDDGCVGLLTFSDTHSSTLSQAHFANSDFQPQIWNAEEEYNKRE